MSLHTEAAKAIRAIATKAEIEALIASCALDKTDAELLRLRYIGRHDFGYIADMLGMSYNGTARRHKAALLKMVAANKMQKRG